MLTFIAFALTIAGCVNWLLIGLLQYDFVAGIFGYQGSVFSRLVYILVGAAALFLVVKLFLDKGSIHIWGKEKSRARAYASSNIEASQEAHKQKKQSRKEESGYRENEEEEDRSSGPSLFDEHLDRGD